MTIRGCHRFRRIILIIYIYILYIYIYHTGLYPCFMPNHCTTMRNRKNKAQRYGSCSIGSGGCPMTKRWSATVRCRNAAHTWPTSASRSARRSYLKSTSRTHTDVEFELIGTSPWEHVQHCDLSRFEHFFPRHSHHHWIIMFSPAPPTVGSGFRVPLTSNAANAFSGLFPGTEEERSG